MLKDNYKLSFGIIFLTAGLLLAIFVALLFYQMQVKSLNDFFHTAAMDELSIKEDYFNEYLINYEKKLLGIATNEIVLRYLKNPTEHSEDSLKELFATHARDRDIMQIRLLSTDGKERIRIDSKGYKVSVIADEALQDKSDRYYFRDSLKLAKGEIFRSKIDLNVENGEIEKPYKPTYRIATKVFEDDEFAGVLIINFDLRGIISRVKDSSIFTVCIVDREGFILIGAKEEYNWSRYLGSMQTIWKNFEDAEARAILTEKEYAGEGVFSKEIALENGEGLRFLLKVKEEIVKSSFLNSLKSISFALVVMFPLGISLAFLLAKIPDRLNRSVLNTNRTLEGYKKRLDEAQKIAGFGIIVIDTESNIVKLSDGAMGIFETSSETAALAKIAHIVDEDDRARFKNDITHAASEHNLDKTYETTYKISVGEKKRKHLKNYIKVSYDFEHDKYLLYIIVLDITGEEKKKEEDFEKQQLILQNSKMAALGEMVNNIAHHWRQPLNVIGLVAYNYHADFLNRELTDDVAIEHYEKIRDTLATLSELIDDFRIFLSPSRIATKFDVEEVVRKSVEIMLASLQMSRIKVNVKNYAGKVYLRSFVSDLSQVIISLLGNAKDEIEGRKVENGEINITITELGGNIVIEVADNAGGIEEAIRDRIFDIYFTTKKEGKGSGIGLYMSKIVIEKNMGGKIFASNKNSGAVFRLEIPLFKES